MFNRVCLACSAEMLSGILSDNLVNITWWLTIIEGNDLHERIDSAVAQYGCCCVVPCDPDRLQTHPEWMNQLGCIHTGIYLKGPHLKWLYVKRTEVVQVLCTISLLI